MLAKTFGSGYTHNILQITSAYAHGNIPTNFHEEFGAEIIISNHS